MSETYRVAPGSSVDLSRIDTRDGALFAGDKAAGKLALPALNERLEDLQEKLYAEGKHRLLIVLQAMDAGGKDGTIRHVFDGVNPAGVQVAAFKAPTPKELAHDFLWRVHAQTPARGMITIFNRSHYEDVLVVRVKGLVPEERWRKRYGHINDFERLLTDEGTTILKFFLHISKSEQAERFQARLDEPDKRWKFRKGDLDDRALWDEFQAAYTEMLERTSTAWAPWIVVPADRKWYRNIVISRHIIDTLEGLGIQVPEPEEDLSDVVIE